MTLPGASAYGVPCIDVGPRLGRGPYGYAADGVFGSDDGMKPKVSKMGLRGTTGPSFHEVLPSWVSSSDS
jgi:hypothetical protein